MCDWIEMSFSCLLKSANLLPFQPLSSPSGGHLRLELAERPGWRDACAGLIERCEPYWEKQLNIQAYMRAWVYSASMNTSELQAVMTISPPRFSRTVLLNVLLLSRGEWLRGKIGVGGVINLKKNLSFAKISASSGASQAGLWIKTSQFDIFSFYQTSFPCPWLCAKPSEWS